MPVRSTERIGAGTGADPAHADGEGRGQIGCEAVFRALGHDLRTPLAALKTAVSCLLDPALKFSPRERGELLEVIDTAADRLGDLVTELLDSSRLVDGAVRPSVRPVDCTAVVARATSSVPGGAGVEVRLDGTLPLALADPDLLERVVANLLDNALRHGRPRHPLSDRPAVLVRAHAEPGRLTLYVVDHGRGLPSSAVCAAPRRGVGGPTRTAGLGMALVREFTEAMGGSIETRTTPGGGLTVVIALPSTHRPIRAHADPRWLGRSDPAMAAQRREGATA
ncbi:MAG TPA: ATP-binding protein [Actinocrinis sp.]|nr:ATP-binding protein [Actinocrinis sp.]